MKHHNLNQLAKQIKQWGEDLGFAQTAIADDNLHEFESRYTEWISKKFHGEMDYMVIHGNRRTRPKALVEGTVRIITVRMNYLNQTMNQAEEILNQSDKGYISRYALGRDYHKVIRNRLQKLADKITHNIGGFGYRVFCDSAPVLEKSLAEKSGQGWLGKHTNIINRNEGSWFFLGEIYTDIPLPIDQPTSSHCGSCSACIDVCPTGAIVAPYQLDARKCISYHTIELHGAIPVQYRKAIGNRIYGCDDCQLVCPWNRYAKLSDESDFKSRHNLDSSSLVELFAWDEATFLKNTEGSAIRRIGHERWLRNIAVALGNATYSEGIIQALQNRINHPSPMVREHVEWAIQNLRTQSVQNQIE